jgi:ABC-type transport system substrate-binding protein
MKEESRMKKRWLICIGLVIALVLSISLGGCRDGSKTSGSSGGGSDGLAVEEENGSESNDEFDPQTETDKILYEDVEAEFGPLPEVPDGTTIGAIVSSQTNEYWVMFAEGIKDKCKELGIELDLQAAKSEDDQSGQLAQAETLVTKIMTHTSFLP